MRMFRNPIAAFLVATLGISAPHRPEQPGKHVVFDQARGHVGIHGHLPARVRVPEGGVEDAPGSFFAERRGSTSPARSARARAPPSAR